MLRDSFWYPNTARGFGLLVVVVGMVFLHQSEFLGLMDAGTLVFGWLPIQLAFDIGFNLVGVLILYAMYRAAPTPPAAFEPTREER
ncbi:hypothetical protein [Halorarum salinum]|uniref:Uncharacterized protein n=1 Tax=Halorarum salinum TaxID=2743089 RepID=A0A7D5QFA0_9EURY|nr:hypothetical protein [Halobaculum salinum]QLG61263.1 hypothetical protein HUG12_05755 [Halobaculum salinum]